MELAIKDAIKNVRSLISPACRQYDCEICNDTGSINWVKDGYTYGRECECRETKRTLNRIEKSGLMHLLDHCAVFGKQKLQQFGS
jgi:hypothetical protein